MHYQASEAGPIKLVSGQGQYLYDANGERYLDCVNNVCHVGHCHPRIVTAAATQLSMLNTNSRYMHDNIVRLAAEVAEVMPDPLSVCFFVNSGSEANDLALRLARAYTNRRDVYCVREAYHGNSASTLAISAYNKYAEVEAPDGSVVLTCPDAYREKKSAGDMTRYCVNEFDRLLSSRAESGNLPAAYIVESLICCGGQVVLPPGYLPQMHALARRNGALAIADEGQVGFGRIGSHYWCFEAHGAIPDIVTIGKPFGNGFPLAAVVTTSEIAEAARNVEYFNTFGGNPVACAVGMEVLRVIEEEGLQQNAQVVGEHTRAAMRSQVMAKHASVVGDVRGMGLIFGVEFVSDVDTREPDADLAQHVMHHCRTHSNVLVSTDGPHRNVIKIKPPLCITMADGAALVDAVDNAIAAYSGPRRMG